MRATHVMAAIAVVVACGMYQATAQEKKPETSQPTATTGTPSDAEALADFKARLAHYLDVRGKAVNTSAKRALPLKETKDPAKIKIAEDALAATIRGARWDAKPGDILTPAVGDAFRRL